jgi:hypothetical protein
MQLLLVPSLVFVTTKTSGVLHDRRGMSLQQPPVVATCHVTESLSFSTTPASARTQVTCTLPRDKHWHVFISCRRLVAQMSVYQLEAVLPDVHI